MNLRSYLLENDFKIILSNTYINILNYIEILSVSSNNIKIKYKLGIIDITGINLVIKKLLKDEILIIGIINKIELGD